MSSAEYISTRGESGKKTFDEIVLEGLAPDRGLYVPESLPRFSLDALRNLANRPYVDQFVAVRSLFVGDSMDIATQSELATQSYTGENFPEAKGGVITPVRRVGDTNIYIQDLSGGPTAAFKDMALQVVGRDMGYFLKKNGQTLRILGATSGDTGSAAEAAVKDVEEITLYMLSPETGMSEFQRGQMASLSGGNVHNLAINARFSTLQTMVKDIKVFEDGEFQDLGAVNSINWARIASQIPYYFAGYLQTVGNEIGREIDVVVPSGNMGNALAAFYARKMGVPIRRIIAATNENDVLDQFIQTGEYKKKADIVTSSPSMDITSASNLERVIDDILGRDPELTRRFMEEFEETGAVSFESLGLDLSMKEFGFESGASNHKKRIQAMRWVYSMNGRDIIDPHTADGIAVAHALADDAVPTVVMETAKAVKFEIPVREAIGYYPTRPQRFEGIEAAIEGGFVLLDEKAGVAGLASYIRSHS